MYLTEIHASGFRCFGPERPLTLALRPGLNILVGSNDAGKTAAIDVPRLVLWTRGDEFVRLDPSDFYVAPDGNRVSELLLRCTFDNLTADEEARFLEWCSNEAGTLRLHLGLRAALRRSSGGGDSVATYFRAGLNADGPALEGDLREYIRATYLRPLRDAERELRAGRRSRLSRILGALPSMANQADSAPSGEPQTLADAMEQADNAIESHAAVAEVESGVNQGYLGDLSFAGDPLRANLGLGAKGSFTQLLERFELSLDTPAEHSTPLRRGLGYNNLLFMAAELLLLESEAPQLPVLLIEEPEAHLHPQHQSLFMQVLEERADSQTDATTTAPMQVLVSTHSPQLAANANLDAMVMLIGHKAYPLAHGHTRLSADDYGFLRRFLDATKANLFFARALVIVEGTAENILVPAISRKLDRSFAKHGVSIVNVGHRGLFRYSRILQRADGTSMPIPVALLPDRDIPPDAATSLVGSRPTEGKLTGPDKEDRIKRLTQHDGGAVRSFPSEQWTLEFDLARQPKLASLVLQAAFAAQGVPDSDAESHASAAKRKLEEWRDDGLDPDEIAVRIYEPLYRNQVSKPQVAEALAFVIEELDITAAEFAEWLPRYMVEAIAHVTPAANRPTESNDGDDSNPTN